MADTSSPGFALVKSLVRHPAFWGISVCGTIFTAIQIAGITNVLLAEGVLASGWISLCGEAWLLLFGISTRFKYSALLAVCCISGLLFIWIGAQIFVLRIEQDLKDFAIGEPVAPGVPENKAPDGTLREIVPTSQSPRHEIQVATTQWELFPPNLPHPIGAHIHLVNNSDETAKLSFIELHGAVELIDLEDYSLRLKMETDMWNLMKNAIITTPRSRLRPLDIPSRYPAFFDTDLGEEIKNKIKSGLFGAIVIVVGLDQQRRVVIQSCGYLAESPNLVRLCAKQKL
jgi:hypothetical protein